MELAIEQVSKRYRGGVQALSGVSLDLGPGVHGLLGPNGAGKSSLMRILATITRPSEGSVQWNGVDIASRPEGLRRVLGYLPQDFGVYPNLTPVELLSYLAAVKGLPTKVARQRIDGLLEMLNLSTVRKRRLGGFSGGMRQRVGIAQALLNDPQLLIVDEPTAGLDPEERVRFRHLLMDISEQRVVLLSTHVVSDLEATASDIAIIEKGRLLATGSIQTLKQAAQGQVWVWSIASQELAELRQRCILSGAQRHGTEIQVRVVAHDGSQAMVPEHAQQAEPTLEDAYLLHLARGREAAPGEAR